MRGMSDRSAKAAAAGALSVFILLASSSALFAEMPRAAAPRDLGSSQLMAQAAPASPGATTAAPATPSQSAHHHRRVAHRHGMMAPSDPAKYVEARISDLHKRLHITTEQEPQFKAYADVMRSNAQAMQALFQDRAQSGGVNALDRLRWYAKLSAAHADQVGKLVPPFEALYQSMTDEQKKIADKVFEQIRQRRPAHRVR